MATLSRHANIVRVHAPRLIIMVKEPVAGRVKTRLARTIGSARAAALYRSMQTTVIERLAPDRRWHTTLAIAPDTAVNKPIWPRSFADSRSQGGGSLGTRLQRQIDDAPLGPVVIIGSDIPGIVQSDIAAAFRALGALDAVVGPSRDGGFWLIGLGQRSRARKIFGNVRWSTSHALADTLANMRGMKIAQLGLHDDVDTADDLVALQPLVGRRVIISGC